MINLVHQAGLVERSNEPLATLASYRRVKVNHQSPSQICYLCWSQFIAFSKLNYAPCRGRFYLGYYWDMRFRIRWGCKQGHGFEWEKKYIQIQNRQYCKTRNCQPMKQMHKIQSLEQSIYMRTIAAAWIYIVCN
jgi:hypothetical protein